MSLYKQVRNDINALRKDVKMLTVEVRKLIDLHRGRAIKIDRDIFELPRKLQETMVALTKLRGQGTATMVSKITGKTRAVESANLNTLVLAKRLIKERKGREKWFTIRRKL